MTGQSDFDDGEKRRRYKQWRDMYFPQCTETPVQCSNEKCQAGSSVDKIPTYESSKKSMKLDDAVILYSTGSVSMESLLKLPTPVKKASKKPLPKHSSRVITSSESIAMFKEKQQKKEEEKKRKEERAAKRQQMRNGKK